MKFHERFDIEVDLPQAKRRFVNRVHNEIFLSFLSRFLVDDKSNLDRAVASALGEKYRWSQYLDDLVGSDFLRNLQAIEALFAVLSNELQGQKLNLLIQRLLSQSEVDLGIEWHSGRFLRKGAALLDEILVNDPLRWLRTAGYQSVLSPFENGMSHFLTAKGKTALLSVVIADMYESVEALAKIVTGRSNKDLSANQESFISKVSASEAYKTLLRDYITYANNFRHPATEGKTKPQISEKEVESFIYLTGVFVRLAMPETKPNTAMNPPPLRR